MTGASKEISEYFDSLAGQWSNNYAISPLFKERLQNISDLTSHLSLKDKRVLDLGCGTGVVSSWFVEKHAFVNGIDIAPNMVSSARQLLSRFPDRAQFDTGDATALRFENEFFDLISCISVIEWIEDDKQALQELSRVLRKSGMLIISFPNKHSLFRILEYAFYSFKKVLRALGLPVKPGYLEHQKHQYALAEFEHMLRQNGFTINKKIYYSGPMQHVPGINKCMQFRHTGMMIMVSAVKNN